LKVEIWVSKGQCGGKTGKIKTLAKRRWGDRKGKSYESSPPSKNVKTWGSPVNGGGGNIQSSGKPQPKRARRGRSSEKVRQGGTTGRCLEPEEQFGNLGPEAFKTRKKKSERPINCRSQLKKDHVSMWGVSQGSKKKPQKAEGKGSEEDFFLEQSGGPHSRGMN